MARFLVPQRDELVQRGTFDDLLAEDHLARFIWRILCGLDLSDLEGRYRSVGGGPGRPPYHPRLLAALWIYGLTQGVEKATRLAQACQIRDDFRWLAGGLTPCDQTLLNFLDGTEQGLASIWNQVIKAMDQEGLIDLSAVFEDGTKQRANASPKSFRNAEGIDQAIKKLKSEIAEHLKKAQADDGEHACKIKVQIDALRRQLKRAEHAACELDERRERRSRRSPSAARSRTLSVLTQQSNTAKTPKRFGRDDFRQDPDRDTLICPAGEELRLIGVYPMDHGRGTYRLYGRPNCIECPLQDRCTNTTRRRVKIPDSPQPSNSAKCAESNTPANTEPAMPVPPSEQAEGNSQRDRDADGNKNKGPRASLTEPEAVMMLATSEKVWQPSYNADISVTRDGIIVSQFLTKAPTDFHHFGPALESVRSVLRTPDAWVGDGHYGTRENLLLAHHAGVLLYASSTHSNDAAMSKNDNTDVSSNRAACGPANKPAPQEPKPLERFRRSDFRHDAERDVMICPADQELAKVGVYPTENGLDSYRLYRRRDCRTCSLKEQCTAGIGRSLKVMESARP